MVSLAYWEAKSKCTAGISDTCCQWQPAKSEKTQAGRASEMAGTFLGDRQCLEPQRVITRRGHEVYTVIPKA